MKKGKGKNVIKNPSTSNSNETNPYIQPNFQPNEEESINKNSPNLQTEKKRNKHKRTKKKKNTKA